MQPIFYILALSIFALTPSCGFSQEKENTKVTVDIDHQMNLDSKSTAAKASAESELKSDAEKRKIENT